MNSGIEPLEAAAQHSLDETVRRLALERSHELVTLLDPDGTLLYASGAWTRLGWDPGELAGTPMLELIHPDDLAAAAAGIAAVVGGSALDAVTVRIRRADATYAWFETTGTAVRGDEGEVCFLLGTARDVSEREELRRRLRDLDAVYRFADAVSGAASLDEVLGAALDALLDATGADRASVLLADDDGVLRFRAWRGLSDAYRAATEGHSPWEPDATEPQPVLVADVAAAGFDAHLERTVRAEGIGALAFVPLVHGERLTGKFMLYHDEPHEWSEREVLLCSSIASHLGTVVARTQAQDALRTSREHLAAILRTVEEGITVQSREGRLAFANEAAARDLGFATVADLLATPREELLRRYELLDANGDPLPFDELPGRKALEGSAGSRVVRYRARDTGDERWAVVRATPIRSAGGEVELAVNVTRDITEEMRAQQREQESRSRLELLLEATRQITGTLDLGEILRRVPDLVVPRLADACHVYLAEDDGARLRRVASAHADPELAKVLESIDPVYEVRTRRRIPLVEVFRTGEPQHLPSLPRPQRRFSRPGDEEAVARLSPCSVMALPLQARGRRFGVLGISSREPGRHGAEDFELATELARRISIALDVVTLHRQAQESLAQLTAVLDQLPLGVVIAEAGSGRLVLSNSAVERLWSREVEAGKPLSEYGSFGRTRRDGAPIGVDEWPLARALRTGELTIGERHDFTRADGARRTMEINAAPVRDADGAIVAGVAIFGDVTDRQRTEERLRFLARVSELLSRSLDLEQTLRAIADLAVPSFAGYLVVDLLDESGELRCVAAAHADPKRAALVRRLREEYPPVLATHPVQVALRTGEPLLLDDLQEQVGAMAHDEKHARAITRIANTSGIVVPLVARGRTLGAISLGTLAPQPQFAQEDLEVAAELARRASLALDNARLYGEAQERAHAAEALEFVDDGVFLVDGAGVVRLWNPAAALSFRRTAEQAVGRRIEELIPDWPTLHSRIPIASEPAARGSRAQTIPVDVDGEERWLSLSAVRYPGGTVYAFRDLTEERAVDQMKSEFVSTVSHELRTPLAAIYGAAMTLRRQDVALADEQRGRLLEVIASESDRLARIVNDILWASRLESGRMSIAIESCDAGRIAREISEALRVRLPAEVELTLFVQPGLPRVAADPDKLRQVLANLLDNAVKYSPQGGRVELEVTRSGGRVRFRVGDEGLGVPPAEQDRIFEKFFRLDPNLARGVGGTGLGLYISRELVSRMEGRIWVVSDGRSGSSFFVELPLA